MDQVDTLGRTLFATACVLASALVAGQGASNAAPSSLHRSSATKSASVAELKSAATKGCIDGACTALAVADTHCSSSAANAPSARNGIDTVALASEACSIPDVAIDPMPEVDPWDYEPAWLTGLRRLDIPFKAYPRIEKYLHYWTASKDGRRIFRSWLKRSGRHRAEVDKALDSRRLPVDLAALVFVESGFSPTAKSKAGAVGLWQLMPETAKEYGLVVDRDYDERRSVTKSSEAAADHLASLYGKLGSWELVLAAYDMGARALEKKQATILGPNADPTADFWKLAEVGALPKETSQYVPQILALALVLKNLDRYGYDTIKLDPALVASDLDVPAGVPLSLVAHAAGTNVSMLRLLNPEFLRDTVPNAASVVHVPASGLARARVMLPHLLFDQDESGESDKESYSSYDAGADDEIGEAIGHKAGKHDAPGREGGAARRP